jgi:hypothetical protein
MLTGKINVEAPRPRVDFTESDGLHTAKAADLAKEIEAE